MLLFEAIRLAKKQLLNESYKDLERLYGDLSNAINPEELKYAYNLFQTESGIKNVIKKELNLSLGGIEKAIAVRYPQPLDFINSVFQAKNQLGIDKKIQVQKTQAGQKFKNELKENETDDFYIIPCRTFEQAHKVANSYTGNLEIMSRDKIREIYNIEVPQPNTFYETGKSPAEFLEFMRQAPFFMAPSWCIAGGKHFWDMYGLDSKNGEPCRCYIIISKRYPNVRFCIVNKVKKETPQLIPPECNDKKCTIKQTEILETNEFRDPWQIGGIEKITTAKDMFCGINFINEITKNKIFKLLQPLQVSYKKIYEYEKIVDGRGLFANQDWRVFDKKLDHLEDGFIMFSDCLHLEQFTSNLPKLTNGNGMFENCENLRQFTSALPNLTNGNYMFYNCKNLKQFTLDLPNLTNGDNMFSFCVNLTQFTSDLPKLTSGDYMFSWCINLTQFTSDLSNLTNGGHMFENCRNLKQFTSDLSNLTNGYRMFSDCFHLEQFTSDLPNLTNGDKMFENCRNLKQFTSDLSNLTNGDHMFDECSLNKKSVLNILKTIPDWSKDNKPTGSSHLLHIGKATIANFKFSLEIAKLLKTTIPIKSGDYTYKGWTIEVA